MKKPNKNISLDNLAAMVADGFTDIQNQLAPIKSEIHKLVDGQDQIKLRLDNVAIALS